MKLRRRLSVVYLTWDIASEFGKLGKGIKKPEKITSSNGSKREVMHRDITGIFYSRTSMYAPDCEWVDQVAGDVV